jgi:hypothetical protein
VELYLIPPPLPSSWHGANQRDKFAFYATNPSMSFSFRVSYIHLLQDKEEVDHEDLHARHS